MATLSPRHVVIERSQLPDLCACCDSRPTSVCNAIEDRDMARLAAITSSIDAPVGRIFIQEGESADNFFNITLGTARLFKLLPDGRRQITGFVGPGHFLGLAVSDTYAFSAEAMEPVRFCRFSRTRLRVLLDDFPALEKRLLEVAATELVAAQEQMLLLGRKTAVERLASFLLTQSVMGVPCGQPRAHLTLKMTRGDIADYLGLTIETISRTLTRLRNDRLIDIPSTTDVIIRNHAALANLAGGLIRSPAA
jgi:CRP/FNR family transcriptional regulator